MGIPPLAEIPEMRATSQIFRARPFGSHVSRAYGIAGISVSCGYKGSAVGEMLWVGENIAGAADAVFRDGPLDVGRKGRPRRECLTDTDFTSGGGCVGPTSLGGKGVPPRPRRYGQKWYKAPKNPHCVTAYAWRGDRYEKMRLPSSILRRPTRTTAYLTHRRSKRMRRRRSCKIKV